MEQHISVSEKYTSCKFHIQERSKILWIWWGNTNLIKAFPMMNGLFVSLFPERFKELFLYMIAKHGPWQIFSPKNNTLGQVQFASLESPLLKLKRAQIWCFQRSHLSHITHLRANQLEQISMNKKSLENSSMKVSLRKLITFPPESCNCEPHSNTGYRNCGKSQ